VLYDVRDWNHAYAFPEAQVNPGGTWMAAFDPESRSLVTTGNDGRIRFWNLATRKEALTLQHSDGPGGDLAFSPDGTLMISVDAHGRLKFWRAAPWTK
jgi:WD40 repeat protein